MLLETSTMFLYLEAFFFMGWARMMIFVPFHKLAPSLGAHMEETTHDRLQDPLRRKLVHVQEAIHIMSPYTWWESKCLVKAIAAMKMLERRRISCTLYMGTARDESGKMIAHAWLRSGPYYITGADGMEKFTVVGTFAKHISY